MRTQAVAALPSRKPDVDRRLEEIASSVRVKLRETGARVVAVGLELSEAKRLIGPGKGFEAWVVSSCGLSVATAYRWIQAAEGFKALRLDQRPDLLDETDVAEMLSVSFPQAFRTRIQARVKALDKAEEDAKEAKAEMDREARKLAKAESELKEADEELKAATDRAERIQAKAEETLKPAKEKAEGVRSKVRDIKARVEAAKGKVIEITQAARQKVGQAQAQAQAARQAVTQAQAKVAQAEVKAEEAKAGVQTEVKAATLQAKGKRNGKGKAEDTKGQAWEVFLKGWLNTLEEKVKAMIPVEKQAEALQAVGNMVLALSQTYKAKAKAA